MTKQERAAKRRKKAQQQAEQIIETTRAAVQAKPSSRAEGCTDEEWALAQQVKVLRDEGVPWWQIAKDLELPGAGHSATTGKKGAANARKAYAKGYGSHPRTFTRGQGKTRAEKNERVKEVQQATKRSRVEKVRKGESVIPPDISNEELAAMVKGRKISWMIMGDHCPDGMEQEAWVHPQTPLYIEGELGDRTIEFRSMDKGAPVAFRMVPAHIRTVRIDRIFAIKGAR